MGFAPEKYNKSQRQAIVHGQGPLLVISGAGTGKTKVLTGRILSLVLQRNIPAREILALTFTEKAMQEMVDRVDRELPLGHEEVWIKTFHSFCDLVLRERGHEIGLSTDYKLFHEADLWMFLKRHLVDFELDYYRPLSNPQKFLRSIQQHFSRLQDEDILPEAYEAFSNGALKNAKDEAEKEYAVKHLELAKAYSRYQALLIENNALDFGGLLFMTLRLFEKRPSVLVEYQKRFRYILVDEFQDTNFAQNKIITLLARDHKNLFVVGDDDQSIYKWRGASLTNISYFQKLFPEAKKIVLNENYRSPQPILDLSYRIIQKNNPNRLEVTESVDKRLIASQRVNGKLPEIYHFPSLQDEVDFILREALKSVNAGDNTAILVRTNASTIPFIEKLKFTKFHYQYFSASPLFTKAGVKDCLALLKVLSDPTDNAALFHFLSISFWNFPMKAILILMQEANMKTIPLLDVLSKQPFTDVKILFDNLIEYSRNHPVSEILGAFFEKTDFLKKMSEHKQQDDLLTDIAAFSEKIKEFEQTHPHQKVRDFLTYIQMLEESGDRGNLEMPLDPWALKILTIHGAKGLEFDTVFIPGLVQGKFPSVSRRDPFDIPQALIREPLPQSDHHLEEERRLFYVACTRARKKLIFSYSDFYDGKKAWKPSVFVAEALESGKAIMATTGQKSKLKKQQTALPLDDRPPHRPIHLIVPKLSYSQLETFRTCPLKYQFRYLFKIPTPMPAVVNFGLSIHNTLRDFYALLQKNPEKWNEDLLPHLSHCYEKNWIALGYENRSLQEDQKKRGFAMLSRFYREEQKEKRVPRFLEKAFSLNIGNVTFSGRIDRIDQLPDGTYEVIDYKTGSSTKNLEKDLQLSLYALACRDALKIPVSKLSLYFLDGLEKASTTRTDRNLDACREEILECTEDISRSDFSPTPGFHCSYCDYRLLCPVAAPLRV